MSDPTVETALAARAVVAETLRVLARRPPPVLVALDGPSGAGKSTVAARAAAALAAGALAVTVVPGDDFFAAEIPGAAWDAWDPRERAARAIDWRRLRRDALEPLLAGRPARWHPFDFAAGARPDGTYPMRADVEERPPAPVVLLDGAYSARPELADLVALAVLVDAPPAVRRARLAAREDPAFLAAWLARWGPAEAYYVTHVRPPETFGLVVATAPPGTG